MAISNAGVTSAGTGGAGTGGAGTGGAGATAIRPVGAMLALVAPVSDLPAAAPARHDLPPPSEAVFALPPPPGVDVVATEEVLLLAVNLPAMPAAQRRAAIGFAVEDRIAQGLDEVQVVLGPQMAQGVWLVAVIARSLSIAMERAQTRQWPDVLLVAVPQDGWAVWVGAGRALVRLPDGTGFATPTETLPAFWIAAGSPEVTLYGGALPAAIPVAARKNLPQAPDPALAAFDLRAFGHKTGAGSIWPKGFRPLAVVLLVAVVAHLALQVADVMALGRLAQAWQDALRAQLNLAETGDLEAALASALGARQPKDAGGALVLLTGIFAAIGGQAGRVFVQELRYAAADDTVVMTLEAPDLGALQAVETALIAAGLTVVTGAATSRDGAAEVQMTLRGAGG